MDEFSDLKPGEPVYKGGTIFWAEKDSGVPPKTAFVVSNEQMQTDPAPNPEPWLLYNQASRYAFEKWIVWGDAKGKEPWILRWDGVIVSPDEIRAFWGPIFARR